VILSAAYMLWLYQRTFMGRAPGMADTAGHGHSHGHDPDTAAQGDPHVSHEHSGFHMPDLNAREWAAIIPMIVLMVWMGIAPQTFLPPVSAASRNILERSGLGIEQRVQVIQHAR
jgi:NADH:ubiquinone oxidoreductase subunit 4 (subunit M)